MDRLSFSKSATSPAAVVDVIAADGCVDRVLAEYRAWIQGQVFRPAPEPTNCNSESWRGFAHR